MSRDVVDLVWPRRGEPDVPGPVPDRYSAKTAVVARDEARANLERQHKTFDSLDTKAATVIAAVFVVIGLAVPRLSVDSPLESGLAALLVLTVGYSLATAVAGYNVERVATGGWDPPTGVAHLARPSGPATAALAAALFHAIANNRPKVERKARFVRRSLLSLAVAPGLLAALFAAGSLG